MVPEITSLDPEDFMPLNNLINSMDPWAENPRKNIPIYINSVRQKLNELFSNMKTEWLVLTPVLAIRKREQILEVYYKEKEAFKYEGIWTDQQILGMALLHIANTIKETKVFRVSPHKYVVVDPGTSRVHMFYGAYETEKVDKYLYMHM